MSRLGLEVAGESLHHRDRIRCHVSLVGKDQDAMVCCFPQGLGVHRVNFAGRPKLVTVRSLDEKEDARSVTATSETDKLTKVFGTAFCHGVR